MRQLGRMYLEWCVDLCTEPLATMNVDRETSFGCFDAYDSCGSFRVLVSTATPPDHALTIHGAHILAVVLPIEDGTSPFWSSAEPTGDRKSVELWIQGFGKHLYDLICLFFSSNIHDGRNRTFWEGSLDWSPPVFVRETLAWCREVRCRRTGGNSETTASTACDQCPSWWWPGRSGSRTGEKLSVATTFFSCRRCLIDVGTTRSDPGQLQFSEFGGS